MYELKKYKHEFNDDGELVVYDVPVFAEVVRQAEDGKWLIFDKAFCQNAIKNAQTLFEINGYMAPFHEEHNATQPSNSPIVRRNLGRFLPKRLQEATIAEVNKFTEEVEPVRKYVVISDLVIKPDFVEDFDKGLYPYLSVEIKNPDFPEFSSLAALTSRPPEHKFSPTAIMPVMFAAEDGRYYQYFSEECMNEKVQFSADPVSVQKLHSLGFKDVPGGTDILTMARGQRRTPEREIITYNEVQGRGYWQYNKGGVRVKEGKTLEEATSGQFAEESQQFGLQDIAKKIASNWAGVKGKLLSNPAYQGLIKKIDENSRNIDPKTGKHAGGEVLISPDTIASWLRAIPVDQIMQLTNFLFAEGENNVGKDMNSEGSYITKGGIKYWIPKQNTPDDGRTIMYAEGEKQNFGLMDDIKALGAEYKKGGWGAVKNKLGSQETEAEFQNRLKEQGGRGFAEGDGMDEKNEQFAGMAPRSINYQGKVYKIRMNGDYTSDAGGAGFSMKEAQQLLASGKATAGNEQGFAEGENQPEQMADGSSLEQVTALLSSASEEVLAKILQLLQGAGSQSADAEGDVSKMMPTSFSAQFAQEVRKRKTIEEKLSLGFELLSQRIAAIEGRLNSGEELQFAAQVLEREGVSQRDEILTALKGKSAEEIKDKTNFVKRFAGRDPKTMRSPKPQQTPEVQSLLTKYAGKETAVLQFAEQWESTSKMVPLDRFVKIQIEKPIGSVRRN